MLIKADLHNHLTTLKEDLSRLSLRAIKLAKKRLGPGGIVGIINAQDQGIGRYETFVRGLHDCDITNIGNAIYLPYFDIYVIKGQEVFTQDGHISALGLNEGVRLRDYRTLEDTLKEARDLDLTLILNHPFFLDGVLLKNTDKIPEILSLVDGIEVHNGEAWLPIPGIQPANRKAQEFYNRNKEIYNMGAVTSSDGHTLEEIGLSYMVTEQLDFSSDIRLRQSLRKLVREHKDYSKDKQTNAIIPTLEHSLKIFSLRQASKLRLFKRVN